VPLRRVRQRGGSVTKRGNPAFGKSKNCYLFRGKPSQVIIDFYEAVAECCQCYMGTKLTSFVKDAKSIAGMGVRDWAILLENIDEPSSERMKKDPCRSLWEPFTKLVKSSFPRLNRNAVKSLANDLHAVQDKRNPYGHPEREVLLGPRPWREQKQDLEEMHGLVVGSKGRESVIKQIINLFGSQQP